MTQKDPADMFGSDTFVFKATSVKDHVTFWPHDSLNAAAAGAELAKLPDGVFLPMWDHGFLPWSARMLLAPSVAVRGGEMVREESFPAAFRATLSQAWYIAANGDKYVELQFWRPLSLEDVERFEFGQTPPSGPFLAVLRAHGVRIFQKGKAEVVAP